jgi:hypothetical protein
MNLFPYGTKLFSGVHQRTQNKPQIPMIIGNKYANTISWCILVFEIHHMSILEQSMCVFEQNSSQSRGEMSLGKKTDDQYAENLSFFN